MYDPTIGRWLTQDPLSFDAGDANLYRYAGNAPTDKVDPEGEDVPTDPNIGEVKPRPKPKPADLVIPAPPPGPAVPAPAVPKPPQSLPRKMWDWVTGGWRK
jgi:hypothetical protein